MKQFKEEVIKFGENISVRGIPKIIKSKRVVYKIVWLVATVVCTSCLIWQLAIIFISYYSYPYKTSYGEWNSPNVFPALIACPLHPKLSEIDYDKFLNPKQFDDKLFSTTKYLESKFNDIAPPDMSYDDFIKQSAAVVRSYLSSLPKNGSTLNSSIPFLTNYIMMNSTDFIEENDTCKLESTSFWNPNFYKCHKYQISESCQSSVNSLTMIFYINNMYNLQDVFDRNFSILSTDGLRMALGSPDVLTGLINGFNLGTGTDSLVNMVMNVKTIMDHPYTPKGCESKTHLNGSESSRYSSVSCTFFCIQQKLIKECQCVDPGMFVPRELQVHPVCGNTSLTSKTSVFDFATEVNMTMKAIIEMTCKDEMGNFELFSYCEASCRPQCNMTFYDTAVHSLQNWPHVSYHRHFFEEFIKSYLVPNTALYRKFESYITAIRDFDAGVISSDELNNFFLNATAIKSNFLQVTFRFAKDIPLSIADSPVYTWESMLGTVGGCLSLWLGVTFMTIIELLEFFMNLIGYVKDCKFMSKTTLNAKDVS